MIFRSSFGYDSLYQTVKDYFKNNTSDVSVDPNSNVGQRKSLNTFTSEVTKGLMKLDGYFLLWKYLEKIFGIEDANELISGCISGKYYPFITKSMYCSYNCIWNNPTV